MASFVRPLRGLFCASACAALLSAPVLAEPLFPAPAEFTGMLRASAQEGTAILPGGTVAIGGQGLLPGQRLTLQRGTAVLAEGIEVDGEGRVSASFALPADAAPGLHPIVVLAEDPSSATVFTLKISPDIPLSGAEKFTVESKPLVPGLYQSAYSARSDALFVGAAVGRPPVQQSQLVKVDPETLEVVASATPPQAEPLPDGRVGLIAVYGLDVDDANGTVWVTNTRQDTVAVYSQEDLSLVKQFEPGTVYHARDVAVDESRSRAWVSAARSNAIEVFDTATLEKLATVEVESNLRGQSFAVMSLHLDAESGRLFTVSMDTNEAAVIDVETATVAAVFALPGARAASGVGHDPVTDRLFVASQQSDNLLIVDLATQEVLHDVPVGAGALNVEFEPVSRLAFVSNRGAGTITVVSPDGGIAANLAGGSYPNHAWADGRGNVWAVNKSLGQDDPQGDHLTRIRLAE